jgi:hypothetical protein
MNGPVETPTNPSEFHFLAQENGQNRRLVLLELERILASPSFRSAARSKQFLTYVIQNQLDGHAELLKERTIGTEVFLRPPGYATGDDPVVRVQAGEVRRRLEQYYQSAPHDSHVRIELPVGKYSPLFHWHSTPAVAPPKPDALPQTAVNAPRIKGQLLRWEVAFLITIVLLGSGVAFFTWHQTGQQKSVSDQFWAPVFATQQPALICLAKGVTYRPSPELYQRYSRNHPGTFQTEVERSSQPLPLDPNEKLVWSEMLYYDGYGVALGDVSAAVKLSALLGKIGKPNQVRIGSNYSFEDLRNSPSIVVGAFNNKWTIDIASSLRFAFVEENRLWKIREQIPGGRVWLTHNDKFGKPDEDYAIVARLMDSKTGQFTVIVAGLIDSGTQTAGEFASNPEILEKAFRNAPSEWHTKNLEVVLQTKMTDSIPGPPRVVATYYWQ